MNSKGGRERYTHLNEGFQRIARKDKKAFLSEQRKGIEENKRMGKTRYFFKKVGDTKGTFWELASPVSPTPATQEPRR